MRLSLIAILLLLPAAASAQGRRLATADSNLVRRILLAEDRRDSLDVALTEGERNPDSRVRNISTRARGRIADTLFAERSSLPPLASSPVWPEPAWRLRLRALSPKSDCGTLRTALGDSAWPVRLRATDLLTAPCANDEALVATLRGWIDALPADASQRQAGGVSWHGAAHALVALARLRPAEAMPRISRLASHGQPQVRVYATRAAALLADTMRLRTLSRDPDDNVKETSIDLLGKLTGHGDDDTYLAALNGRGAQAVRAAAVALKGSPRADVRATASTVYARWAAEGNASAHDVRAALLEAAGRAPAEDRSPQGHRELPPDAVALALGAELRLRVSMAPASGGGSFIVRLRGDVAPIMASKILALSRARYYDGLTWQRVEHDFVIQGGSPGANEYVGLPQFIRDELGTIPHLRGTVGMSTRGHDTGDAQWFVNLRDNTRLGRDYSVFGEVVEGIDVVDGILEGDVISSIQEVAVKP